jgi:ascorbate-specific PTS system EIIC-type component UlaA
MAAGFVTMPSLLWSEPALYIGLIGVIGLLLLSFTAGQWIFCRQRARR